MEIRQIRSAVVTSFLLGLLLITSSAHAEEKKSGGGYVTLEPFTSNLVETDRYLQINISLKSESPGFEDNVKIYMPKVRHVVLMTLCGKKSEELLSTKGKMQLMAELKDAINQALDVNGDRGVSEVVFTNFVVQ